MLPNNKNDANPFLLPSLMNSQKFITPVGTEVRKIYNYWKGLNSGGFYLALDAGAECRKKIFSVLLRVHQVSKTRI